MEQERIYKSAQDILRGLEDVRLDRITFGEALFLFRHCLRFSNGSVTVLATFSEEDLQELMKVARAILARTDRRDIH